MKPEILFASFVKMKNINHILKLLKLLTVVVKCPPATACPTLMVSKAVVPLRPVLPYLSTPKMKFLSIAFALIASVSAVTLGSKCNNVDRKCYLGLRCTTGVCKLRMFQDCRQNDDCVSGRCVNRKCSPRKPGESCDGKYQCQFKSRCLQKSDLINGNPNVKVCRSSIGGTCTEKSDCQRTLKCTSGKCTD